MTFLNDVTKMIIDNKLSNLITVVCLWVDGIFTGSNDAFENYLVGGLFYC